MRGDDSTTLKSFHHPDLGEITWNVDWKRWEATVQSEDGPIKLIFSDGSEQSFEALGERYKQARASIEQKEVVKRRAFLLASSAEQFSIGGLSEDEYLANFALGELEFWPELYVWFYGQDISGPYALVAELDSQGNVAYACVNNGQE